MSKNCLVVSTYFGARRFRSDYPEAHRFSETLDDCIEWMGQTLSHIKKLDSGVPMDIIIANHDCRPDYDADKKSLKFLSSIHNSEGVNGSVKVLNRDHGNGSGGSFKSFSFAFENFKNEYDYWFFLEDDVKLNVPMYFKHAIEQLEENKNVAYICCLGKDIGGVLSDPPAPKHCHGGIGCTHVKYLNEVFETNKELPHSKHEQSGAENKSFYNSFELEGEVAFTNAYLELGYEIETLDVDKYYPNNNLKRGGVTSCHDFE